MVDLEKMHSYPKNVNKGDILSDLFAACPCEH